MNLLKFIDQRTADGKPLYWGRADVDGAPYRGELLPPMPESELEERMIRVAQPRNRLFDLADPEDNAAYLAVLDRVANQWASCLYTRHYHLKYRRKVKDAGGERLEPDVRIKVYVEWVEFFMQDGRPMRAR